MLPGELVGAKLDLGVVQLLPLLVGNHARVVFGHSAKCRAGRVRDERPLDALRLDVHLEIRVSTPIRHTLAALAHLELLPVRVGVAVDKLDNGVLGEDDVLGVQDFVVDSVELELAAVVLELDFLSAQSALANCMLGPTHRLPGLGRLFVPLPLLAPLSGLEERLANHGNAVRDLGQSRHVTLSQFGHLSESVERRGLLVGTSGLVGRVAVFASVASSDRLGVETLLFDFHRDVVFSRWVVS